MSRRFNNRKILYIVFISMIISILSLSLAYAALSVTLNIQGNAQVVAAEWDIHLENIEIKKGSVEINTSNNEKEVTIVSATSAEFAVTLLEPGDFYEFTIDVVNDGDIDAMIDGVTKTPNLTEEQLKFLDYTIEYENGTALSDKQLLKVDSFVRLKVLIEFRKDIAADDLPKTETKLNMSFTVNYTQSSDSETTEVPDGGVVQKVIKVETGDGLTSGNLISIGSERFYVVKTEENNIIALAEHNLQVGNYYYIDSEAGNTLLAIPNATGLQDSSSKGLLSDSSSYVYKGVLNFASINYWNDTGNYPINVYSSDANVYQYVESYKNYLVSLGAPIVEARLIYASELEYVGCNLNNYTCSGAPSWTYSSSYWTGSAYSDTNIYTVRTTNKFSNALATFSNFFGVRPVIVISKDSI